MTIVPGAPFPPAAATPRATCLAPPPPAPYPVALLPAPETPPAPAAPYLEYPPRPPTPADPAAPPFVPAICMTTPVFGLMFPRTLAVCVALELAAAFPAAEPGPPRPPLTLTTPNVVEVPCEPALFPAAPPFPPPPTE